jgi:hypothetical protein
VTLRATDDVGRLGVDGMEASAVLFPLAQSRILLALDCSITCKPVLVWVASVIDTISETICIPSIG